MSHLSITVSVVALVVSVFTFWWTNVREKRALYFVRLSKLGSPTSFDFALVNAGKSDVLVTEVHLILQGHDTSTGHLPVIDVQTTGDSKVVQAGKALEFRTRFLHAFGETFILGGRKDNSWSFYTFTLGVRLSWLDSSGKLHVATPMHSFLGLQTTGSSQAVRPFTEHSAKHELYATAA